MVICILGVGEFFKVFKVDFIVIDKVVVLNFVKVCKINGVK